VLHTGDLEHDLIQMPFVAHPRKAATDLVGELLAELARQCRTVSWLTMMPRAASNSSTMRRPSGKRKYTHTAWPMISAGNHDLWSRTMAETFVSRPPCARSWPGVSLLRHPSLAQAGEISGFE
jgi:hypothetical protein